MKSKQVEALNLRQLIEIKRANFEKFLKQRGAFSSSDISVPINLENELLPAAIDLLITTSQKMALYESRVNTADEILFQEIKSLNKEQLMQIAKNSWSLGAISILRYVIAQKFIKDEINNADELKIAIENLKTSFRSQDINAFADYFEGERQSEVFNFITTYQKGSPFQSWGPLYRYLLPFVYDGELRDSIWKAIEVLRDNILKDLSLQNKWESINSQGWHNKVRSYFGFEGPSNYGSQKAVLMIHPKDIPDHKNCIQLVCYFEAGNIWAGLDAGANFKKLEYNFKFNRNDELNDFNLNNFCGDSYDKVMTLRTFQEISVLLSTKLENAEQWNKELLQLNSKIGKEEIAEMDAVLSEEGDANLYDPNKDSDNTGSNGNNTGNTKNGGGDDEKNAKINRSRPQLIEDAEKKQVKILYPNIRPDEDYLERAKIATGLVSNLITDKNVEPLNIGLYGDWGSGKTQIIHLIKKTLRKKTYFQKTKKIAKISYRKLTVYKEIIFWWRNRLALKSDFEELFGKVIGSINGVLKLFKVSDKRISYKLNNHFKQKPYNIEIIDFDAWQYNDQEHIWAALIMEIMQKCKTHLSFYIRFIWHQFISAFINSWQEILLRFLLIGIFYKIATFLSPIFVASTNPDDTVQYIQLYKNLTGLNNIQLCSIGLLIAIIPDLIKSNFINIDKVFVKCFKTPNYNDQLGFRDKIKDLTEFALKYLGNNGKKRILIFVDNLDRCSSINIKQILDSICQFLEICTNNRANLIAFFAMDKQIVISALQKEGVPENKINEYLDKIINLSVYPKMPDNIDQLIIRFFGAGSEEASHLKGYYLKNRYNPRKLSNLRYIDHLLSKIYDANLAKKEIEEYFN